MAAQKKEFISNPQLQGQGQCQAYLVETAWIFVIFEAMAKKSLKLFIYSRSRGRDEYPLMAKLGKALRNFVRYR